MAISFKAIRAVSGGMAKQKVGEKVLACIRILEEEYGVPRQDRIDPLDLLVMTILSQNTSDTNSLPVHLGSTYSFLVY